MSTTPGDPTPSAIKSQHGAWKSPTETPQNGVMINASAPKDALLKSSIKAPMKERFARIFSSKDVTKMAPLVRSPKSAARSGGSSVNGASSPISRNKASLEMGTAENAVTQPIEKPAPAAKKVNNCKVIEPPQRFTFNPDAVGGHEHYLQHSRRQEKISDMWRNILGKKREAPDCDLSLTSNSGGGLRQGKEETGDRKGRPNATSILVEKYGKCQEVVGRGAFGIVRISHKEVGGGGQKLFAVKEFRRGPEETEKKYSTRLAAEFCISSSLCHPNVIHTLDLLKDAKGNYCEVMEFCAGGDLYTLILPSGKLEVQEADCFFKQMVRGVKYLHETGVAHHDLKPENLLLTSRGALKITDFGNSECIRMPWEVDAHFVSGIRGSAPYIAPEEYTDKEFDARPVDVWACGVIYMAMQTGRHLWHLAKKDEDELYARYLEGRRDEDGYGPIESLHRVDCRNVIYSVLDPHPTRRLTATQILKSKWVREIQLCKAGEEGL
ncbi:kinase domain-containing protein [Thelonectria olida]|uniref:non-specific serine/threonine protein kinase n=1 Tax=Thelonectria olida TaxID=1576542 RepID=A0A9P9ASS3_9HYPO|nr:kinase domain-containing protein [Thelonectria olida]